MAITMFKILQISQQLSLNGLSQTVQYGMIVLKAISLVSDR